MNIILAEHFGMCFGVRDAIAEAEQLAHEGPLTILGELVHNPVVRDRLRARAVREAKLEDLESAQTPQVMITAHGTSDARRLAWREADFKVSDGTCPLVHRAHEQLRALVQLGYFPVVIGKPEHVEVRGLVGDFPQAVVVGDLGDFRALPESETRFGVISQTTQPIDHVRRLVEAIREARPRAEVKFCDTVCQPTKNRQNALQKLLSICDIIVIVGGRESNNTRQLVDAARAAGGRAIHVERPDELRIEWFQAARNVGLTAGTSTLKETVDAVHLRLLDFAATAARTALSDQSKPNQ
jgi:4-hydroxy-3-methylbut-2-enyl diphosphate reductase